jgi:two-component system nitrate/nitrite response regulator NarL
MVSARQPTTAPVPALRTRPEPLPAWRRGPAVDVGELLASLTPAERVVVEHVAAGFSNKEIASALDRAEATIKHQVSAAMRKFHVQSRCQLIVRILT